MALRYRELYMEAGDILDPQPWLMSQNALAGEFNGYLDRDNIGPGVISEAMIAAAVFNKFYTDQRTTTFSPDPDSALWQHTDLSSVVLHTSEITAAVDCQVMVEWSGTWTWTGTWSALDGVGGQTTAEDAIRFRITVDGVELATSGFYGDAQEKSALYLIGVTPVVAGPHTVRVECQVMHANWHNNSFESNLINTVAIGARELVTTLRKR